MSSEKYRLKWSKYESNVLSAFHSLLESESLSDVTLFCEGQVFKAHRLVLAACSSHFEEVFAHAPINGNLFIVLDGTRAEDLVILLHFMYRGEAYLHHEHINSVLRTAEILQVKGLSEGPRSIEINQNNHGQNWPDSPPTPVDNISSPLPCKATPSSLSPPLVVASPPPAHYAAPFVSSTGGHDREQFVAALAAASMYSDNGFVGNHGGNAVAVANSIPVFPSSSRDCRPGFVNRDEDIENSLENGAGSTSSTSTKMTLECGGDACGGEVGMEHESDDELDIDIEQANVFVEGHNICVGDEAINNDDNQENQNQNFIKLEKPQGMNHLGRRSNSNDDSKAIDFAQNRSLENVSATITTSNGGGIRCKVMQVDNSGVSTSAAAAVAAANAAKNLETFRFLASQSRERRFFMPPHQNARPALPPLPSNGSDFIRAPTSLSVNDNTANLEASRTVGSKLRCPFCERSYGYETNLRAHIRQRHQGIRVSCPFCPRTFTRNNTVRRHVAREHRNVGGGRIPTRFGSTRVMPDPISNGSSQTNLAVAAATAIAAGAMREQAAAVAAVVQQRNSIGGGKVGMMLP